MGNVLLTVTSSASNAGTPFPMTREEISGEFATYKALAHFHGADAPCHRDTASSGCPPPCGGNRWIVSQTAAARRGAADHNLFLDVAPHPLSLDKEGEERTVLEKWGG